MAICLMEIGVDVNISDHVSPMCIVNCYAINNYIFCALNRMEQILCFLP